MAVLSPALFNPLAALQASSLAGYDKALFSRSTLDGAFFFRA
jgi:hypothetical protein